MKTIMCIILGLALFVGVLADADECETNLQTTTYTSHHTPLSFSDINMSVTPFFSPDNSLSVEQREIELATESITIAIPYWQSWSGCSKGCEPEQMRNNESFPLYAALLNAIYRGCKVRVLTAPCSNFPNPPDLIDPLSFLVLSGAEVRYYTTTTHLHAKLMFIDDDTVLISSVNFSPTSFVKNREAGMIFRNDSVITEYTRSVFEEDWAIGSPISISTDFSEKVYEYADNKDEIDVPLAIPGNYSHCGYMTHANEIAVTGTSGVIRVSPDWAFDTLMTQLESVKKSIYISIYEVSEPKICDKLAEIHQRGVDVRLLVSNDLYGEALKKRANKCYSQLYDAGLITRLTIADCYTFSHQKYWIVDNTTLTLSTGNWDAKDDPEGSGEYPPPGDPGFIAAFRDYHVTLDDEKIRDVFFNVLWGDWSSGHDWKPE